MATVYLALDLRHGRKVAIKVLRPSWPPCLGPERFSTRSGLLAGLDHPHILTLLDLRPEQRVPLVRAALRSRRAASRQAARDQQSA